MTTHPTPAPRTAADHPVWPAGPACDPSCPGEWSDWHQGYAWGTERAQAAPNAALHKRLNDEYMRGYRAASRMIDAASPEPALDVERLAEAIATVTRNSSLQEFGRSVAAEYARLAEQPKERADG